MAAHWIVLLLAVVPFWLLQNTLHELAHGLALRIGWGWKFSIHPFPSRALGRFTFSHVVYEPKAAAEIPTNRGWALVSIMPRIANGVFIPVGAVLSVALAQVSIVATVLCALFAACNTIDLCVGMASIFRREPSQSDIWRFQSNMGFGVGELRWLAACSIVFGLVCMVAPIYSVVEIAI